MIYGLWLSATGIVTNSHQLDVISNNLANVETIGFKRQMTAFRERAPEGKEDPSRVGDRFFDRIGGGQLLAPSAFDSTQGQFEDTGRNLDLAINGDGYFMFRDDNGQDHLTRDGSVLADREGNVVLQSDPKLMLLDSKKVPVSVRGYATENLEIGEDGTISHAGEPVGQVGLFNVPDRSLLRPMGKGFFKTPASVEPDAYRGQIESGFLEKSNVDPAVELTKLMEAQRMLEANANMIRYQDQSMSRLVNDVGRI